jgi:hypothetical protein
MFNWKCPVIINTDGISFIFWEESFANIIKNVYLTVMPSYPVTAPADI